MNQVYKALSDPTRRKILELLRERDMSAGEISDKFVFSKPAMSKHFSILKEAGLITGAKTGTTIMYSLNVSVLEEALLSLMSSFKITSKSGRSRIP